MGNDASEAPRKPRKRSNAAASGANPFRSKVNERTSGNLEDVPGILGAVELVCSGGRAIMFARTRDGGAWAIQVLDGDARYKQYAADQSELNDLFADLLEAYGSDER